jgi:hypothetical protein
MVPVGLNDGHRNAATTRSGFVLVSTYAWTLITIGVAIARFAQGHAHKVEVGRDDAAIFAATVGYSPLCDSRIGADQVVDCLRWSDC